MLGNIVNSNNGIFEYIRNYVEDDTNDITGKILTMM